MRQCIHILLILLKPPRLLLIRHILGSVQPFEGSSAPFEVSSHQHRFSLWSYITSKLRHITARRNLARKTFRYVP